MRTKDLKTLLWGISVALSWTWGLGLFFSVQMAIQFGLSGLLLFAVPNAIGLIGFGFLTQRIARRHRDGKDFERHFFDTSHSMRYVILCYQLVAMTLTFFAIFRYLFMPLGINLPLTVLLVLGSAFLLGEQFDIRRIKFSHLAMFLIILLSMGGIAWGFSSYLRETESSWSLAQGAYPVVAWGYLGYLVPIICGFLVGPWLDVQQWHRAIQIHREGSSIRQSYFIGGLLFFGILVFHGVLALSVRAVGGESLIVASHDGLFHAKDVVPRFLFIQDNPVGLVFKVSYIAFIFLCIISTLDSGYVSLKWYLGQLVRKSNHVILSLIPESAVASPVLPMLVAVGVAAVSVPLRFELEYFIAFYGSFSIGYAVVFLFRSTYRPEFTNFTQTTLFSIAAFSLGLFGVGYFEDYWYLMAIGALVPMIHGLVVISSRYVVDDLQKALPKPDSTDMVPVESFSGKAAELAITALENAITRLDPKSGEKFKNVLHRIEPAAAQTLAHILSNINPQPGDMLTALPIDSEAEIEHARGRFEGKWYCYTFMPTYSDTNSVGNVYFANYLQYVGKVREMFFASCMPGFDLKNTHFYILTRQIEHKFQSEAREFDILTVRIRIEGFNRKFVTLEHVILNQAKQILGKGKQILMFVSSKDYRLVDLPQEVHRAFLPFV